MRVLGLDIGTTTISAVVVENGQVLQALTRPNGSFLQDRERWEKLQDPKRIRATALSMVDELFRLYPDVERIGVTGQMHGIVYLNRLGEPVSPLYTWQDGRGEEPTSTGETLVSWIRRRTGYPVATGYGLVTHCYNLRHGLVPVEAAVFCTIHDYIAMTLGGQSKPVLDASDAASFGLFDVARGAFDLEAMEKAGIDGAMLPALAEDPKIGVYRGKAAVYVAIGDNQASFLGATEGRLGCMLVNVGTGSQFSVYSKDYLSCPGLETRPFPRGGYLLVGASLCGGRAYALLEQFFRMTGQMLGATEDSAYDAMAALLASTEKPRDIPKVTPLFQGTRQDPGLRGSITGLSVDNFTPQHFLWGMMEGIAGELHQMYCAYRASCDAPVTLMGSGNGLRKNPWLQHCFSEAFGQELILSRCNEEAATGAALFAAGR